MADSARETSIADNAPAGVDIGALLDGITPDAPCGDDPRRDTSADSPYQTLRTLRTTARNNERAALAGGHPDFIQTADWQPIVDLAPRLLRETGKDLEVTAWLIEAMTRVHGFRGLATGLRLAAALIEAFGEALHPRPDDEGKASQLAALAGLNGQGSEGALIAPIRAIPLTDGGPGMRYAAWQCDQAFDLERTGESAGRSAKERHAAAGSENIRAAVRETSAEELRAISADLTQATEAYERYCGILDAYCADDPQPTARIRDTLDACRRTLNYLAGDRLRQQGSVSADPERQTPDGDRATTPSRPLTVRSREDALQALASAAAYFRRAEPHSPVSYAVEQAIRWSDLSLPELIDELIPDEDARRKYRTLAGVAPRGD